MPTLDGEDFVVADFTANDGFGHLTQRPADGEIPAEALFPDRIFRRMLNVVGALLGIGATSQSSLAIGTGSKTFALDNSLALSTGNLLKATSAADDANWMIGAISAKSDDEVTIAVTLTGGSGTHADWILAPPSRIAIANLPAIASADGASDKLWAYDASAGSEGTLTPDAIVEASGVKQGEHIAIFSGSALAATTTSGAGSHSEELATNDIMLAGLAFDQTSEEKGQLFAAFGESWDGGPVEVAIGWKTSAASSSQGVAWGVRGRVYGDGEALDAALGTEVVITDTNRGADRMNISAWSSAVTLAGTGGSPTVRGKVGFVLQVARKTGNAADDLAADAVPLWIAIRYTIDRSDES